MELKSIIEAILFNAQKPLSTKDLRDVFSQTADASEDPLAKSFKKVKDEELVALLEELAKEHEAGARTFRLVCVAGAWQFVSQPEFAPWIKTLVGEKSRPGRLSQPALETLAIIAYRQPLTRAEIEQIRGVAVDGVMQTLLERGIVEQTGRAEVVGRPSLYGTTPAFLEYFGLRGLDDLPAADELRKIPVKKPESLLTVEPGLATAPPEQLAMQEVTGRETAPVGSTTSESRATTPAEPPTEPPARA
ncbi:MAG: SMC-Scp complex subunit ScpB [Pedosphaera sp. Tous-C6FEB]|nr:MAG: SMC-Scp complex subunit ScpB [Pedosphaera sp. Tous-C6FEB]